MRPRFLLRTVNAALGIAMVATTAVIGTPVHAQGACSSDGQRQPDRLLERFTSADCQDCWGKPPSTFAAVAKGALALDWLVPSTAGDEAPLSAAATRDSLERLTALKLAPPAADRPSSHATRRGTPPLALRVAMGPALGGYVGASIEWPRLPTTGQGTVWLALVETIPAGVDGTPIARNLIRNLFTAPWTGGNLLSKKEQSRFFESRAMGVPENAQAERLAVVGWVEDNRQRLLALAASRCAQDGH